MSDFNSLETLEIKPFGWAVIGTGRIANTVMHEITRTERHKVVAAYSRTMAHAEDFAKCFDATAASTLESAIYTPGVEGVYIATPHSVHYKYICECIKLGIPVLCEKAFTVNAAQAEHAISLAREDGVYLCEGMWTRFNPVVKQVRKWIEDGEIGEIMSIRANFSLPLWLAKPFVSKRVYLPKYAGGALLDLGVYPIAYVHMLLGVPKDIECKSRIQGGVDFHDEITLHYSSAVCRLHCSFDKLEPYTAEIVGTRGKISSPMFYKPTRATLKNSEGTKRVCCKRGYIYQFDTVANDIRNKLRENALMPLNQSLEIMKILDACRSQNAFEYPSNIESVM